MGRAGAVTCRDERSIPVLPPTHGHIPLMPSISRTWDLCKCSGGFYGGRIFFLQINILCCSLKHVHFTYTMGGLLRQEGRLLIQTNAAPPKQ